MNAVECYISPMENQEKINPWKTLSSEHKYENAWISITEHKVIHPGGTEGIYGVVHAKTRAVGILPIDDKGYTWLVGQYRYALSMYSWEIPEGGGALNTDPLISAKRELKEETGIEAKKWESILEMHLSNSISDESSISYLARDLTFGKATPEPSEQLKLQRLPFDAVFKMVLNGEITDAIAVATILKAQLIL